MSPEERLARITGRPVSQTSPTLESPPPLSDSLGSPDNLSVATNTLPVDDPGDPPLESLRRDVTRGSVTSLGGPEADLLSGLLGSGADSPLAGLMGAPGGPAETQTSAAAEAGTNNTDLVWVLLAVAVRLVLDTEYS